MTEEFINPGDTVLGIYKDRYYKDIMQWPAHAREALLSKWEDENLGRNRNRIQSGETLNFPTSNFPQQLDFRSAIGDDKALNLKQFMDIMRINAGTRLAGENAVNSLRSVMGMSSNFSLPKSAVSATYLKHVMGLQDDEIVSKIIHMANNAGLESMEDYDQWYNQWGFDRKYYKEASEAFEKYIKGRAGEATRLEKEEELLRAEELAQWKMRATNATKDGTIANASDSLKAWLVSNSVPAIHWDGVTETMDKFFTQRAEEKKLDDAQRVRDDKRAVRDLTAARAIIGARYSKSTNEGDWWKAIDELQAEIDSLTEAGANISPTDRDQALDELKLELDHIAPVEWVTKIKTQMQYQKLASREGKTNEQIASDRAILRATLERDYRSDPILKDIPFYRDKIHKAIEGTIQALQPDALDWPIMEMDGAGTEKDPMYINRVPTNDEIDAFLERGITHVIVSGRLMRMNPDK
jgi:hypothetical protein